MIQFKHLSLCSLLASAALLSACGPAPDPNAGKVASSCMALGASDASAIIGVQVTPNRLTGDDAPMSVCAYMDATNNELGLVQTKPNSRIPDPAADLKSDRDELASLQKQAVKPGNVHDAQGFGPGAFFIDSYKGPSTIAVELHLNENGYKVMTLVVNPKDFATGEAEAATMAQKVFANIQNGTGLVTP